MVTSGDEQKLRIRDADRLTGTIDCVGILRMELLVLVLRRILNGVHVRLFRGDGIEEQNKEGNLQTNEIETSGMTFSFLFDRTIRIRIKQIEHFQTGPQGHPFTSQKIEIIKSDAIRLWHPPT